MVPTSKSHKMPRSFSLSLKNCVAMPGRSSGQSYPGIIRSGSILAKGTILDGSCLGSF